jgi:hypothetical protein
LAGLKVEKMADWAARQAAYLAAAKAFLSKLKPDFSAINIKFVRALNLGRKKDEPRLFLSVDCATVEQ